jgi:hypothetical protein
MKTMLRMAFCCMAAAFVLGAAASGALARDVGGPAGLAFAAANDMTPGWTGRVIVRGNHSTVTDDAVATRRQQTGSYQV